MGNPIKASSNISFLYRLPGVLVFKTALFEAKYALRYYWGIWRNWYIAPLLALGLMRHAKLKLVGGTEIDVDCSNWRQHIFSLCASYIVKEKLKTDVLDIPKEDKLIQFTYKEKRLCLWLKFFPAMLKATDILFQIFVTEPYEELECEGKDVIDIGAYYGDTALYFMARHAKRVICLEANPWLCRAIEENISLNGYENVVVIINGIYSNHGEVVTNGEPDAHTARLVESSQGKFVEKMNLKKTLESYKLVNPVLKVDCEGGEYTILEEENETLKRFEEIIIEYHFGYKNLIRKLKSCGFEVRFVTGPIYPSNIEEKALGSVAGIIHAKRK